MVEILNRIDNSTLGFLAFMLPTIGGLILLGLVAAILGFRQHARTKQQEDDLKREMIAKGMSSSDIERVIQATAGGTPAKADAPPAPATAASGPGFAKARLVQTLVEQGMDAVGIEKVLRVLADYADDELAAKVAAVASMVEQGMEADDIERGFAPSSAAEARRRTPANRVSRVAPVDV